MGEYVCTRCRLREPGTHDCDDRACTCCYGDHVELTREEGRQFMAALAGEVDERGYPVHTAQARQGITPPREADG